MPRSLSVYDRAITAVILDPWCLVPYYTAALAGGLRNAGVYVTVASPTYDLDPDCFQRVGLPNKPGAFDLCRSGRLHNALLRRGLKTIQGCANLLALALRYTASAPDIVHVQQLGLVHRGIPVEMWFLRFAKRMGTTLVYTVHNLLPHDTGTRYHQAFARLYSHMDLLICHSEAIRDRLQQEFLVASEKLAVIPHGTLFADAARPKPAEARARLRIRAGESLVLCHGFLRPYKGLEFLLKSWREVQAAGISARLMIAGTGPADYIARLQAQANDLGISATVDFRLGFANASEVVGMHAAADVVVYAYREITSSGALMTGISAGQAIIATDLPAFREVLRHGHNALLVQYGDARALAAAILRLCTDPTLSARLRAGVELTAPAYSWDKLACVTAAHYQRTLERAAHVRSKQVVQSESA